MREITEQHEFSRDLIEKVLKFAAKSAIMRGRYSGYLGEQTVEWKDDNSAIVITKYIPMATSISGNA